MFDVSENARVDWNNFCREVCIDKLRRNPIQLEGFYVMGEPAEIEIDESHFFKRKHHRGLLRPSRWVFRCIEGRVGQVFFNDSPEAQPPDPAYTEQTTRS